MDRLARRLVAPARAALAVGAAVAVAACGDPLVVLGDWPGTVRIIAGVPDSAGTTVDSTATSSLLLGPRGVAVDDEGVLYIADESSARILRVRPSGVLEELVNHQRCRESPCLGRPAALALDGAGHVFIADPYGHRVWRLDPDDGALDVLAGTGEEASSPDGVAAGEAAVYGPSGVAVAPDGTVYFGERFNNRVRSIARDGTLGTLAGTGVRGFDGDGGAAASARLNAPTGLALVGDDVLYVADTGNQRIRAIDLDDGTITTAVGTGVRAFGGDGGQARLATLKDPIAVAVSPDRGRLFVADMMNHRVRVVNLRTDVISTFAGTGDEAFNGDLRPAGETALGRPAGVAVSARGVLYVADVAHHVVRRTSIEF